MFDAPSWAERLGGDLFLAQSYFRSHLVVRGKPDDFAGLASWSTLNQVIATHRLEPPTTRRSVVWHRIQPAELHARIREGASLVVDSIDEIHPPIMAAAEGLERFLRTPVQVNAYASWTAAEGFGTHWDDHDVVVCQVEGAKRWRIYGPTRQAPTWRDTETPDAPEGDAVLLSLLLAGEPPMERSAQMQGAIVVVPPLEWTQKPQDSITLVPPRAVLIPQHSRSVPPTPELPTDPAATTLARGPNTPGEERSNHQRNDLFGDTIMSPPTGPDAPEPRPLVAMAPMNEVCPA
ncbi:cupin domain-containing protein [Streptomyces sp. NBC_00029]|uniref:JmjC domain-containing protein n=1 Tax=Streptomyces sp. NBC_00029 TaxID=2903613 RepID=UPI00324971A5